MHFQSTCMANPKADETQITYETKQHLFLEFINLSNV